MSVLVTGRKACVAAATSLATAAHGVYIAPMNSANAGEYHDSDFQWKDIANEARHALQEQVPPVC